MLALIVPMLAFSGCGSESQPNEPQAPKEEVLVELNYSFVESGSMSRSGEDAYQKFFDTYIKTKILAPKNYTLTFNTEEGITAQSVSGPWAGASVKLREGTYQVSGNSFPSTYKNDSGHYKYASDSLYVKFDEPININKDTKAIPLSAQYDCYLLLFNAENISEIHSTFAASPQKAGDVYYLFVNAGVYTSYSSQYALSIIITRKDGTRIETRIGGMGFEKGKYYYFDDVSNSFNIEPMLNGN